MSKIGFTGNQVGMSKEQRKAVYTLYIKLNLTEFHHGDCIASDETAHKLALYYNKCEIIIHPPENPSKRAFCKWFTEIREEKPYIERNHAIVDETECLIATPKEFEEQLRSGTWATFRYAKKTKKKIYLVYPDGSITEI